MPDTHPDADDDEGDDADDEDLSSGPIDHYAAPMIGDYDPCLKRW
jgi:hypothetical protein